MTTTFHGTLHLTFDSAVLLGGYRTPPGYADAATAVDDANRALLPASALKGALREACTRLLQERGEDCCDILAPCMSEERQRRPQGAGAPAASREDYCLVCWLFGATGAEGIGFAADAEDRRPGAAAGTHGLPGGLRLSDAVLDGDARDGLRLQPGVSLDRLRGAATPGLLFLRQVFDATGREVAIPLTAQVKPAAWELLRDAVPLLRTIGAGRSRGLGQLHARWEEGRAAVVAGPVKPPLTCVGALDEVALVEVEALEPLSLGGRPGSGYVLNSLHHLPGSALRAAIAAAVVAGGVAKDHPALQAAFMATGEARLRFSDALPIQDPVGPRTELSLPVPPTLLRCKRKRCEGILQDTLVRGALALAILEHGGIAVPARCPTCNDELKPAERGVLPSWDPPHRFVTRVGLDPQTGSAMPGMLYTVELLQKGSRFLGTVAGLSKEVLALLPQAGPIRVGRGRSRGQGLVRVTLRRPADRREVGPAALKQRRQAFVKFAQPLLALARGLGAKELPEDAELLLPVLLRTDLALPEGESLAQVPERLARAVWPEGAASALSVHQRVGEHYGYSLGHDQGTKHGPRAQQPVAQAGSVYLLRGKTAPALETLAALESTGLGEDRHLGLGLIQFYPRTVLLGQAEEK